MRVGWVFFGDFRPICRHISKTVHFRILDTKLLWDGNRKPYASYRMVSFSMTLSDPWPGFQGHGSFKRRVSPKRRTLQTQVWSKKTCKNVISVDHIDDKTDDADIANVFKDSFNVFSTSNDIFDNDLLRNTDRSFTKWKFNVEIIDNVIRNRMKSGKAAGYDSLT